METQVLKEKTVELLKELKNAGYETVAIFCRDPRCPVSMEILDGEYFGDGQANPVTGKVHNPYRCVCAHPETIGEDGRPKIWAIMHRLGLTAGQRYGGDSYRDSKIVLGSIRHLLDEGFYDLSKDVQ